MTHSLQIHLKNVRFFSFHGIYKEETKVGGEFEVNLEVTCTPSNLNFTDINNTINYVSVYELVAKKMAIPTPLLETIATETATEILQQFPLATAVFISIDKINPPIENFQGSVGVSFTIQRK
jgi:dihydroneopterin aldolase